MSYTATSVQAALSDGVYHAFTSAPGRAAWKGLLAGSSLQSNCNQEGLNNNPANGWNRIRIGILGNEQTDCSSPDSYIGLGGASSTCGTGDLAAGDIACYTPDNGTVNLAAMGYLFVR